MHIHKDDFFHSNQKNRVNQNRQILTFITNASLTIFDLWKYFQNKSLFSWPFKSWYIYHRCSKTKTCCVIIAFLLSIIGACACATLMFYVYLKSNNVKGKDVFRFNEPFLYVFTSTNLSEWVPCSYTWISFLSNSIWTF